MGFINRVIRSLGSGRIVVLLLLVLAFAAGYRLVTFGWLAADEADPAVQVQPTLIPPPTHPPAIAAGLGAASTSDVTRRPTTAVILPGPTSSPTSVPSPTPSPTPAATSAPTPVPASTATPIPTAQPTVTPIPTPTPNPVDGWVASVVPARSIDADQLPVDPTNEFTVGANVYVATEFRDIPAGAILGIAWYREGLEIDVWETGPQFGFERANFAFFHTVSE